MQRHAYHEMADVEGHHWWFRGRREILRATIQSLKLPTSGVRILEVGAGTGGNISLLQEFGATLGVERDAEARATGAFKVWC